MNRFKKIKCKILPILLALSMIVLPACKDTPGRTEEPTTAPPETRTTEPPTEADPYAELGLLYDPETKTVTVPKMEDYSGLEFPAEIKEAKRLLLEDEEFALDLDLVILQHAGWSLKYELSGLVDRTQQSFRFIREYVRKNAGDLAPAELLAMPVTYRISNDDFGYSVEDGRIVLCNSSGYIHRDYLYVHALLGDRAKGWEQLGFAWYLATCVDPYGELVLIQALTPQARYYSLCIEAGVDPEHLTPDDFLTINEAVARIVFDKGLTGWGSTAESKAVNSLGAGAYYTRTKEQQTDSGDRILSQFMAAAFLGWLSGKYGDEAMVGFVFGEKTFQETFGVEFMDAYKEWKAYILDKYPMK